MVIKGQDPLKIKKKLASCLTANHVISWLYFFWGRVDISGCAIRNHWQLSRKPLTNHFTFIERNMAKKTFDKSRFQAISGRW